MSSFLSLFFFKKNSILYKFFYLVEAALVSFDLLMTMVILLVTFVSLAEAQKKMQQSFTFLEIVEIGDGLSIHDHGNVVEHESVISVF